MSPELRHYPDLVAGVKNLSALNACKDHVDAVYFSIDRLSLRSRARDITMANLSGFVNSIHDAGLRGYLAVNSVIYPKDMALLREVMDCAEASGVDSVICWDPAAISEASDRGLRIHISTQANVSNWKTAEVYRSLGADRVVLSRELSLEQIRDIREHTDVELEVFVHGAMCQAISGRCYLSAYLLGGSGNCGDCTQPCRWEWDLVSDDGSTVEVGGNYLLSAKDLCMIEHVPKLVDSGVDAFKLEGRLRDPRYTSTVSRCYSMALSSVKEGTFTNEKARTWKEELESVYHRGFSTGFYFGNPSKDGFMLDKDMNASKTMKQAVGVITNYYSKNSAAALNLYESSISIGDKIVIEGHSTYLEQEVKSLILDGSSVQTAEKGAEVGLAVEGKVRENDRVSKMVGQ
ncbi:putative protease [Methanohalophilus levihalophilus]|uniref:peptidase U32 family protein n=1 Tax=Methanohalophilus levihalophilus TaxID=1431282 RepID=UPI001FDAAA40|nr:peptidase U32 family protein [Methanohalophilus levihalophilus]MBP2030451.1 putative protease [Methanohalophilus levihalophilus]